MKISSFSQLALACLVVGFSACTTNSDTSTSETTSTELITTETGGSSTSGLSSLETDPCSELTEDLIKKHIAISVPIRKETNEATKYSGANCGYYWAKADSAESANKVIDEVMGAVKSGGQSGINFKNLRTDYYVQVSVSPQKMNKAGFIPQNKMTDEEIEAKAQEAAKKSIERMKPDQIKILGGEEKAGEVAANGAISMLKKLRDELVVIEGVGDAAYWNPIGADDMLQVLVGDKMVLFNVYVSDERQKNIDVATKIAKDLLK